MRRKTIVRTTKPTIIRGADVALISWKIFEKTSLVRIPKHHRRYVNTASIKAAISRRHLLAGSYVNYH